MCSVRHSKGKQKEAMMSTQGAPRWQVSNKGGDGDLKRGKVRGEAETFRGMKEEVQ